MVITCHARNRNIQLGLGKLTRESCVLRVASSEPSRHAGQMPQWWQFSLFSPTFVTLVGNDLVHFFCDQQLQNNETAHKTWNTLGEATFSTLHLPSNLSLAAILWESFTKQSCINMTFSICKTILRAWQFENDEITKPGPRKRWDYRASETHIIPLESQIGRRDSVIFTSKESQQMNYRRCLQLWSNHSSILHSPWQRQEKKKILSFKRMHLRGVAFSSESKTEPVLLVQTRFRAGVGNGEKQGGTQGRENAY